MKKVTIVASIILSAVLLFSACSGGGTAPPEAERVFYVNAIEIKGATDGIAPPPINPQSLEETFSYRGPGVFDASNPDKWQVSSYQFNPSALTVFQGDTVKLLLFVVNGDLHVDRVEDPDGQVVFPEEKHNRGRQYEISFVAEKAGVYQLRCAEHAEAMRLLMTVIPRA